jgi:arylsulfatase A-like enzyme
VDLAVAGVVFGIVQALVETGLFAWLHRDLLLAPLRFFPTHSYDAFAKIWLALAAHLPLPLLLQDFLAQGMAPKVAIAAELVAINVAVAVVLAAVLAPIAGLFGVGRSGGKRSLLRALLVVAGVAVAVHLVGFALAYQAPEERTAFKLLRAAARDLVQGGAVIALAVLTVSAWIAHLVLRTRQAATALAVTAALLVAVSTLSSDPAAEAAREQAAAHLPAPSPAAGSNVILISIDSLRADHLGAYGYPKPTSPEIDRLAAGGVLFRHSISTTSWTLPSHMSLLTGRSLLGHGVVSDDRSLPASVPTVAEAFQAGGYTTKAIVSAPYLHSRYGFPRGFDDYDDRTVYFETNEDSYRSVTAPKLLDATEAYLAEAKDRPFFLFLHFWDVHYDYAPGAPYDTMFDPDYTGTVTGENFYFDKSIRAGMDSRDLEHLIALYDGEIRLVDDHIARLGRALERLGIAGRTIVAVVADHGDEFFEHGNKGHHRTLYEEVLRTPFVLNVPGRNPSRPSVDAETSLIDVGPTLLGLAGLARPQGSEGRDWSGLWTGAPLPQPGPVHAELYRTGTRNVQVAAIDGRRKVIHHFQRRGLEAYDLAADPAETKPLAPRGDVAAPVVADLGEWLNLRWQRFDRRLRIEGLSPVVLDEKSAEQLRSLGYLQ